MPTRRTKKKKKTVHLDGAVLAEVQQRIARIRDLERDLATARDGLNWLLYQNLKVDLAKENWTLDPTHWTLERNS